MSQVRPNILVLAASRGNADALMANAPGGEDHFFTVPKVVE